MAACQKDANVLPHLLRHLGKLEQLEEPGELLLGLHQAEDGGRVGKQNSIKGVHHTYDNPKNYVFCG